MNLINNDDVVNNYKSDEINQDKKMIIEKDLESSSSSSSSSSSLSYDKFNSIHDSSNRKVRNNNSILQQRRRNAIYYHHHQDSSFFLTTTTTTTKKELEEEKTTTSLLLSFPYNIIKVIITILGLIIGLCLCFNSSIITIHDDSSINQTLGIAIWMATLWLTEIIPLVVTAFLPLVLFPTFGILSSSIVASQYINNTIFLLISGFMIALTLERWNLHHRFSLKVLSWCGTKPQHLLLGMMCISFILSMFISNTATTLMMVPNAISVCKSLEEANKKNNNKNKNNNLDVDEDSIEEQQSNTTEEIVEEDQKKDNNEDEDKKIFIALLLGIAYSANIGGMSSLIGTAPNLVFQRQLELLFPNAPEITFATYIAFGLPVGFIMFIVIWVYLCLMYLRKKKNHLKCTSCNSNNNKNNSSTTTTTTTTTTTSHEKIEEKDNNNMPSSSSSSSSIFHEQYISLGEWSREQIIVCILFICLCFLWLFRRDLVFGSSFRIPGWSNIFPNPSYISDGTTGMFIVILMFICPARTTNSSILKTQYNNNNMELEQQYIDEEEDNEAKTNKYHDDETQQLVVVDVTTTTMTNSSTTTTSDSSIKNNDSTTKTTKTTTTGNNNNNIKKNDTTLLNWETANKMPYDVIFLLGGGFALAKGFVDSGLSKFLGDQLSNLPISFIGLVYLMITLIIWLTELTSNTSTSNIMIPIAASISIATKTSPYTFMIPATMACSCAFVLPIATPPNMVVFSTKQLPMKDMNIAGLFLNIICSFILLGATFTIIPIVLNVDATTFPSWAAVSTAV